RGRQWQLMWASAGDRVVAAGDRAQAIDAVRLHEPTVVTLDLGLPPDPDGVEEGFATLPEILRLKPDTQALRHASGDTALEARHQGHRRDRAWCPRERPEGDLARRVRLLQEAGRHRRSR